MKIIENKILIEDNSESESKQINNSVCIYSLYKEHVLVFWTNSST